MTDLRRVLPGAIGLAVAAWWRCGGRRPPSDRLLDLRFRRDLPGPALRRCDAGTTDGEHRLCCRSPAPQTRWVARRWSCAISAAATHRRRTLVASIQTRSARGHDIVRSTVRWAQDQRRHRGVPEESSARRPMECRRKPLCAVEIGLAERAARAGRQQAVRQREPASAIRPMSSSPTTTSSKGAKIHSRRRGADGQHSRGSRRTRPMIWRLCVRQAQRALSQAAQRLSRTCRSCAGVRLPAHPVIRATRRCNVTLTGPARRWALHPDRPRCSGNSGGPVLDDAGRLVGVVQSKRCVQGRQDGKFPEREFRHTGLDAGGFLDAHRIAYDVAGVAVLPVDLAEQAEAASVRLECVK